jgi:hypothetical protein
MISCALHPEGVDSQTGNPQHNLYSGCDEETKYLLGLRKNICHYAQIIDTYAPCIVGSGKWNNDVNMEANCATTDRALWNKNILSISDEAFMLLCLINYGKRWFAEVVKSEKMVRNLLLLLHEQQNDLLCCPSNRKRKHGLTRTTKT